MPHSSYPDERADRPREFILGGQRSGKSRLAEQRAVDWLAASSDHRAVMVATAQAHDDEMRARILRHRQDRALRLPAMSTVEESSALAEAIVAHSAADTMVVVDCLTLWLTHLLMPHTPHMPYTSGGPGADMALAIDATQRIAMLVAALRGARGPIVLVGNEIGLGVIPLGGETRAFVDALGRLNQEMAAACDRVTLMVAGLPLTLKAPARPV
ncbi:bifunctional adenosylcobinamide kinase/adenosylcobinamide-phosphate guanylyltransferase [Variovorax sp. PAMC28562]|uniref:bifunctional adenosylcobinamide kinase/adenosylcobinamide-phosphate guanylyltransferase n=1 Tax=Variovorax sp. PAMC28562 TaxID=2762323 RepID=UPI00164D9308|nr:bifunctional adenosylcobinamide kinase/adenosylcobinamide-phosphate guanylyltransferase [Variovorax sp. PAMC28562]QNK76055.1 bifunctional adenosylcobinamide kinase/adenosylcobinamide-phosphate guanylyltransferase [Variovorax sp. PAMC28562]